MDSSTYKSLVYCLILLLLTLSFLTADVYAENQWTNKLAKKLLSKQWDLAQNTNDKPIIVYFLSFKKINNKLSKSIYSKVITEKKDGESSDCQLITDKTYINLITDYPLSFSTEIKK